MNKDDHDIFSWIKIRRSRLRKGGETLKSKTGIGEDNCWRGIMILYYTKNHPFETAGNALINTHFPASRETAEGC